MKIFISWSGDLSKKLAICLKDWLPNVIQCIDPYVSSEDIDKGARWHMDISSQLDSIAFGIICLTKQNISAPWVNFEAGALGKSVEGSRVCPLLFDLMPSDIQGPIAGFQTTKADDYDDFLKLMFSINSACPLPMKDDRLEEIFRVWWPMLNSKLEAILKENKEKEPSTNKGGSKVVDMKTMMILEEILEMNRSNYQMLRDPTNILPENYLRGVLRQGISDFDSLPEEFFEDLLMAHDLLLSSSTVGSDMVLDSLVKAFSRPMDYLRDRRKFDRRKSLSRKLPLRRQFESN